MSKKSDLPFGSEFSPSQIELSILLGLIKENEGNWRALEKAILEKYFIKHGQAGTNESGAYNRSKLANNCKLGLISYQIITREGNFTAFGRSLYNLRNDESKLYTSLARHILLNLNGMNLVSCVQDMTAAGEEVNLTTLREGMAARSIHYPPGGKHPSIMRLWLAKAGVFIGSRWQTDDMRISDVLGVSLSQFDILANFSPEQRAFLRSLGACRT